jgi:hypothetical protein
MFLRTSCLLPDGMGLKQEQFSETWMTIKDAISTAVEVKVRDAGWHFMWLEDACSHFAFGRTSTSAISKAITLALDQIKGRFNAAELASVGVSRYPGFQIARVTLHARQIQRASSLGAIDELTVPQLSAR